MTGLVAWLSRSAGPASAIAALLLFSRVYFWWRMRILVRRFDANATPWMWGDGLGRSSKEAEQALKRRTLQDAGLETELKRLRTSIAGLLKAKNDVPIIVEPRWWDLRAVFGTSTVVTLAMIVGLLAQWAPSPRVGEDAPVEAGAAVSEAVVPEKAPTPRAATLWGADPEVDIDALVATGRYEVIDDGFGRQLRGPLRKWTFFATDQVINPLDIVARAPASAEQSAFALVSGTLLVDPYPRKGVNVLLAVRVPTTRGFGFLVFNTRDRKLLDNDVLLVRESLEVGAWYQLGTRRIGYLGTPEGLQTEISLAPP
jgi:hypothetical protein